MSKRREERKTERQEDRPPGEIVTVTLTDMAQTGEALGRVDGVVLFVPFGMPGDRAEVLVTERKRNFARGQLLRLVEPAPERVTPPCPYFTICGGCEWQHMPYAEQVRLKEINVRTHLTRIGKVHDPNVRPCLPSPQPYGYRNHARLQRSATGALGYRAARSHEVVAVEQCPILEPALNAALQRLTLADQPAVSAEIELRVAMPLLIGAYTYHVAPGAFFQANTAVAAQLVTAVLQALALQGHEQVLELYCGGGLFTVPLAAAARYVLGIEGNAAALADAHLNAVAAGVSERCAFITAAVEQAVTDPALYAHTWDAIVLDPPRAGVAQPVLATLLNFAAPTIVYVSCDPATLARDAQLICAAGYQLVYAQPLDMFPQTHHVETVALFARA